MVHLLFPEFLEDNDIYESAELFWQRTFNNIAEKYSFSHQPYFNTRYANGRKMYLGNPMFTAMDTSTNRGVRIIQCTEEEAQPLYISGDVGQLEGYENLPLIDELVIDLVLSEESKIIAEKWIYAWMVEEVTKGQMIKLIEAQMILVKE